MTIGALSALPVVMALVMLAVQGAPLATWGWALSCTTAVAVALGVAGSAPALLERRLARRLVLHGQVRAAKVVATGAWASGQQSMDVALEGEAPIRFRMPTMQRSQVPAVGSAVALWQLPGNARAVGVEVPGMGLVTTR